MYSTAKAKGKAKEGSVGSNASTPRTDVETPRHNVGMYSTAKAKGKAKAKMRNTQVKDVSKQESGKDSPKNGAAEASPRMKNGTAEASPMVKKGAAEASSRVRNG